MATGLRISILFKSFDHDNSSLIEYLQRFSFIFLHISIGTLFFSWSLSFLSPPFEHKENRHRWVLYTSPCSFFFNSLILSYNPLSLSLPFLDIGFVDLHLRTHTHHILIPLFSLVSFFGRVSVFRFSIFLSRSLTQHFYLWQSIEKRRLYPYLEFRWRDRKQGTEETCRFLHWNRPRFSNNFL